MGPVEEPGGVKEEGEGRLALGVVLQEVLGEDLLDGVGLLSVETTVSHGAGPSSEMETILYKCVEPGFRLNRINLERPRDFVGGIRGKSLA